MTRLNRWCTGWGVLIVLVWSVLILQQGEGTVAEGIAPLVEPSGHSHAQEVSTDAPRHHVHTEVSSQNSVGGQLYSLFMHHAAGYFVFAIGILLALDRATQSRRPLLRYVIGTTWMLFGLFIFVRANPDGWPMGAGFWDSWSMPTAVEWLQHKVLSLIPMGLALYAFRGRHTMGQDQGGAYVTVGLAIVGAVGLLSHQHLDHPGLDLVNMQHRVFAGTSLLIAVSLLQEARGRWVGNHKGFIVPTLLILLSLQLVWYTE